MLKSHWQTRHLLLVFPSNLDFIVPLGHDVPTFSEADYQFGSGRSFGAMQHRYFSAEYDLFPSHGICYGLRYLMLCLLSGNSLICRLCMVVIQRCNLLSY
jgi:hypothetical protein